MGISEVGEIAAIFGVATDVAFAVVGEELFGEEGFEEGEADFDLDCGEMEGESQEEEEGAHGFKRV